VTTVDRSGNEAASTAPNASTAHARVLVDELARCGVTDAVLSPGSRSAALAFALDGEPRIRVHVHPDERSAAFVALGIARATGRPSVVVVTSGTAVANLHPAVLEADAAGVPLIVMSADRPSELRDTAADQTIAQAGIFGGSVRFAADLGGAEDRADAVVTWRATASRVVAAARGLAGPPGPVHLNVAFREPTVPMTDDGRNPGVPFLSTLDGRAGSAPWVAVERASTTLDDATVQEFARRLVGVERGLVLVGSGAEGSDLADAVERFATAIGWPVLAEGHTNARHVPAALRAWPHLIEVPGYAASHRPDIVIRIGRVTLTRSMEALLGPSTRELVLDAHGRWWDPRRTMSTLIAADPCDTLLRIADVLAVTAGSAWSDAWRAADEQVATALRVVLDGMMTAEASTASTLSGPHVARCVQRSLGPGDALVVGSSLAIRDLDRVSGLDDVRISRRRSLAVHSNRGVAGIDGTVSTALGVALGIKEGGGRVTALVGDLTCLHDTNAWLLSPDSSPLDLTVVVIDDDGGAIFSLLPPAGFSALARLFTTPHGRDLAHLAALHGLTYERVQDRAALEAALTGAAVRSGVTFVHVIIEAEVALAVRTRLAEAARIAVGALGA
jgi:2-succinyl-5-enolpyruvyl-6-hydroxy-3-cyclohexene-1-carboxylate synthase